MEYISVTQVLDYFKPPQLVNWILRVGKRESGLVSRKALKFGTRVHGLIHEEFKTGAYKLVPKDSLEVRNCMKAWEEFKDHYSPKIYDMEVEMTDTVYGLIGHRDMIVNIGGKPVLVDIKASSSIRENYWLQVNAYKYLSMDLGVHHVGILRFDKVLGTYEYKEQDYDPKLKDVFYGLLEAYRFYNKGEKSDADTSARVADSKERSGPKMVLPKARSNWPIWNRKE